MKLHYRICVSLRSMVIGQRVLVATPTGYASWNSEFVKVNPMNSS